jgi:hypothetical protein
VLDAVRELVAELHPYASPLVHLDSALDRDLGLDRLAMPELLVRPRRGRSALAARSVAPWRAGGSLAERRVPRQEGARSVQPTSW